MEIKKDAKMDSMDKRELISYLYNHIIARLRVNYKRTVGSEFL